MSNQPTVRLYLGDCLDVMPCLEPGSIDMVLCDLPYGTTKNKWDAIIPFAPMWSRFRQLCAGATILTAAQPFTTALIASNLKDFRYTLVWDKVGTTGFQTARVMPLRRHEDICVFYPKKPIFNPIMETRGAPRKKGGSKTDNGCYGSLRSTESFNNTYYPTSIVKISNASKSGLVHPTQKPIALMEYLVRTYTNEGDTVLDCCMGSGSTGVACINTGRCFVGIENDPGYYAIAEQRIREAKFGKPVEAPSYLEAAE